MRKAEEKGGRNTNRIAKEIRGENTGGSRDNGKLKGEDERQEESKEMKRQTITGMKKRGHTSLPF